MKIRSGFVSNSSSSSFIIAKKKGVMMEDIKSLLASKYRDDIIDFCENDLQYCYDKPEDEDVVLKGEELYDRICEIVAIDLNKMLDGKYASPMKIEDWILVSGDFGDEDEDIIGNLIYTYISNIDLPDFKIKCTGN